MRQRIIPIVLFLGMGVLMAESAPQKTYYVYVAPIVKHDPAHGVFTTFAVTNTTQWWFNPSVNLVNSEGDKTATIVPLMKGFGTWQSTTYSIIGEPFHGSVWIVSAEPLIGFCYIHQLHEDGTIGLIANAKLELMEQTTSDSLDSILNSSSKQQTPPAP